MHPRFGLDIGIVLVGQEGSLGAFPIKEILMKQYKPLYTTGLFVLALYGLTSFNPASVYSHLSYLNEGAADFASEGAPASAEGTFANYIKSGDSYKVNRSGKGYIYTDENTKLKIVEFKKLGGEGIAGKSQTEIVYEIEPSRDLEQDISSCRSCRDAIKEKHTVTVDTDYDALIAALRNNTAKDQAPLIKSAIEENYTVLKNSLADLKSEDIQTSCMSGDYFDVKECFVKRFELADQCSKSSSRKRSGRGRASVTSDDCANAEDKERIREDFQDWITELALDEDMSDRRLSTLKSIDNSTETNQLIATLIEQRKKIKEWNAYNKQYAQSMKQLTQELNASTDAVQRKKIILEIEGGAQKYQRFFKGAFEADAFSQLPLNAAEELDARIASLKSDYAKTMNPYKSIIKEKFLTISDSSIVEIEADKTDISQLTADRNSRGAISGYDYNSMKQNFTYQGPTNQNGQRNYNSNDPYMTQNMPASRFNNGTDGRNWNNWRSGTANTASNYQPQQYQQQPYYQPGYQQSRPGSPFTNAPMNNQMNFQQPPRYY